MQPSFHPGQVEQTKWKSAEGAGKGGNALSGRFCTICGAWEGELGNEPEPELYISHLTQIFSEVRRVLRKDGTLWLNLGASYAGAGQGPSGKNGIGKQEERQGYSRGFSKTKLQNFKSKDMIPIPWMAAMALQRNGWYLRQDIIWSKGNCFPESVMDRCTRSHEYIFLLSKSERYYYDSASIREPCVSNDGKARNKRSVWTINTQGFRGAHFAVFPPELVTPCILAGCPLGGLVLDPFMGSGTVAVVSKYLGRNWVGCELNEKYKEIALRRISEGYAPKAKVLKKDKKNASQVEQLEF